MKTPSIQITESDALLISSLIKEREMLLEALEAIVESEKLGIPHGLYGIPSPLMKQAESVIKSVKGTT